MPSLGPAGRGGARRRTRRRMNRRMSSTPEPTTATTPVTSTSNDSMDALKKLGELHDAGILTDDEFSAKKADILEKM